jgi:hypothetical protein
MGRVVIRAIKAFVDGGGSWSDVDKLKQTAQLGDLGQAYGVVVDPLGLPKRRRRLMRQSC